MNLGTIPDIRLKELFDVYLARKADQIRVALGYGNSNNIVNYLLRLVGHIFSHCLTRVATDEIGAITGDGDLSSQRSIYLALLDEDTIIEERPSSSAQIRFVSFVYEAFMEYLVARAMLTYPDAYESSSGSFIIARLEAVSSRWINAKGVADFIGVMLFAGESGKEHLHPIAFMRGLANGAEIWRPVMWSIIGKLEPAPLTPALCDLVPDILATGFRVTITRNLAFIE